MYGWSLTVYVLLLVPLLSLFRAASFRRSSAWVRIRSGVGSAASSTFFAAFLLCFKSDYYRWVNSAAERRIFVKNDYYRGKNSLFFRKEQKSSFGIVDSERPKIRHSAAVTENAICKLRITAAHTTQNGEETPHSSLRCHVSQPRWVA